MKPFHVFIFGVVVLILAVLPYPPLFTDFNAQAINNFKTYVQLQENIIDREHFQRGLLKENQEIQAELNSLNHQLKVLAQKITVQAPTSNQERAHPQNRITDRQIDVRYNRVFIDIRGVRQTYLIDSNSMDPLLDEGATVLSVPPESPSSIAVGDIVIFTNAISEIPIVHRVHAIEKDEQGLYFITKGDNNADVDPFRVRYSDIVAVVVGILY